MNTMIAKFWIWSTIYFVACVEIGVVTDQTIGGIIFLTIESVYIFLIVHSYMAMLCPKCKGWSYVNKKTKKPAIVHFFRQVEECTRCDGGGFIYFHKEMPIRTLNKLNNEYKKTFGCDYAVFEDRLEEYK